MTSTRAASSAARASSSRRANGAAPRTNARASPTPRVTGAPGMFDTRIAYVAESGVGDRPRQAHRGDGQRRHQPSLSHRGDTIVLTPRLSPEARRASPSSASPAASRRSASLDLDTGQRAAAGPDRRDELRAALFARRQPDRLLDDAGRQQRHLRRRRRAAALPQRLTTSPGIDTDAELLARRQPRSCSKATARDRSSST